jgi:hypothetical protein
MWKNILTILLIYPLTLTAQQYSEKTQELGIQVTFTDLSPTGGVSFCDFNQDGWDDLSFATDRDSLIRFYLNNEGQFELVDLGISNRETVMQLLWADYDNDGDKDLYVNAYDGINRLYQNQGSLVFEDVTQLAGMPMNSDLSYGACWGDYNRDGWLDLYVMERKGPQLADQNRNVLLKNNGDGTFTEVTNETNTADGGKKPFCAAFMDVNNDMWPDLYIANDKLSINTLLMNQANGTFVDLSMSSGGALEMNAMCVAVGDYDADGWQDIYITNTQEGNRLLKNQGIREIENVAFEEVAMQTGTIFNGIGWGSNFIDADNDGDLDLYVSGSLVGSLEVTSGLYVNNFGFFNKDAPFAGDTVASYSNATGDYDNDGYPDIAVTNYLPFNAQIWQNRGGDNRWLKIDLEGVKSNRDGIGSRIEIYTLGTYQQRFTFCGIGFLGQNSNTEMIGAGENTQIDSIVITWPTGHQDRLFNVPTNTKIKIIEGSTTNGVISVDPDIQLLSTSTDPHSVRLYPMVYTYPNPGNRELNIKLQEGFIRDLKIFDVGGQLILSKNEINADFISVKTASWSDGNYFILLSNYFQQELSQKWTKVGDQ